MHACMHARARQPKCTHRRAPSCRPAQVLRMRRDRAHRPRLPQPAAARRPGRWRWWRRRPRPQPQPQVIRTADCGLRVCLFMTVLRSAAQALVAALQPTATTPLPRGVVAVPLPLCTLCCARDGRASCHGPPVTCSTADIRPPSPPVLPPQPPAPPHEPQPRVRAAQVAQVGMCGIGRPRGRVQCGDRASRDMRLRLHIAQMHICGRRTWTSPVLLITCTCGTHRSAKQHTGTKRYSHVSKAPRCPARF